jgi:hypothetical protein
MTNQETISALFGALRHGTDQEKSETLEFIRRHENRHLLYDPNFVRAAVANADLFGIVGDDEDEFENDDVCPCCGQPVMQEA